MDGFDGKGCRMFRLFMVFLCVLVLLVGCSDSSRDRAATQALEKAQEQEQLLPAEQAIALYQAVVDSYPQTEQAKTAQTAMVQVKQRQRQSSFQQRAHVILERVSTVLTGYQAYSGKLPVALKDLDAGEYMFDSTYLAEILPEGTSLYLSLAKDRDQTRMWLQQAGQQQVLSRTLGEAQSGSIPLTELQALQAKWQEVARVGRLTQVHL